MRPFFVTILLFSSHFLSSQNVDSLINELNKSHSDQEEILILRGLGGAFQTTDPDKAISYYRRAEKLSQRTGDSLNRAKAFNSIAISFYYSNEFDSSLHYYFRSLNSTTDDREFYDIRSRLYNNIGWDYQKRGLYSRAIDYFKESIKYSALIEDTRFQAFTLNNLGVAFKNKGDYDSAEFYLRRSLVMNREMGNRRFELYNINNLGVVYLRLRNTEMARDYLTQALEANYERQDSSELLNNLTNIGELLLLEGNYRQGLDTLGKALPLAVLLNNDIGRMNIYDNTASIYEQMGDYKQALMYHERMENLQDSLFRNEIANYELDFQMREEQLRREKQDQAQKLYSSIITLSLISAFVIIFILIRFYLSKQKSEQKLLRLNEEISSINQNLERTVEERTRENTQNVRKVNEFAYVNAHKLRGPLASMLGLIEILNEEGSPEEREKMIKMISESAREIDRVVNEIAEILSEDKKS